MTRLNLESSPQATYQGRANWVLRIRNNRTGASVAVVGATPAGGLEPAIERMLNAPPSDQAS